MLTDVNIIRDALKQKAPSFVQGGIYPSLGFLARRSVRHRPFTLNFCMHGNFCMQSQCHSAFLSASQLA